MSVPLIRLVGVVVYGSTAEATGGWHNLVAQRIKR